MAIGTRDATIVTPSTPRAVAPVEEYDEISLLDIARVLYRRRIVLGLVLLVAVAAGFALVLFTTPEYQAEAVFIPLEHERIIIQWLESHQAAEFVVSQAGSGVGPLLFPDRWDAKAGAWEGQPPAPAQLASALNSRVRVTDSPAQKTVTISVTLSEPSIARDVAAVYLLSLDVLRPELENITRSQLFDKYYVDSGDAQDAQRRAETVAGEKSYWLVFDSPSVPSAPVKPRPVLYVALASTLGIMGGVGLVFVLEWLTKYRADFTRLERRQ